MSERLSRRSFVKGMMAAAALAVAPIVYLKKKVTRIYTGARARIFVNGKEVGYYDNVEFSMHDIKLDKPVVLDPTYSLGPLTVEMQLKDTPELRKFMKGPFG